MNKMTKEWARRCAINPGKEWRLLAHEVGKKVELINKGEFDELVVGHWLHVEKMDRRMWWMRVGDARLTIVVEKNGEIILDIERGYYEETKGKTILEKK